MMMNTNLFLVLAWVALIATVSVSGRDQGLLRGQVHNEERELTAAVWSNDGFLSQYDNGPGPYGTGDSRRNWNGQGGVRVGVNGAYTGLAGGVNGKSSESRKSKSKSAPALPVDLPPKCEDVGDPVYGPSNPIPQPVLPSDLVRTYTIFTPPNISGGKIDILDKEGIVDIDAPVPCSSPNTAFPDDAVWCAEGQQQFRITAHTACLQSITDDYYFINYVKTQGILGSTAGECTLVRVSRKAPGTWTEFQTPEMANSTAVAAIEWAYDSKPVDRRYKFSLCPNPEDKDKVNMIGATFV